MYGQPVKFLSSFLFAGGQTNGDGGTHQPSGQWIVVSSSRSSMLVPFGHEDSDEATDIFRRVRVPVL